jgi:hypothetical protein
MSLKGSRGDSEEEGDVYEEQPIENSRGDAISPVRQEPGSANTEGRGGRGAVNESSKRKTDSVGEIRGGVKPGSAANPSGATPYAHRMEFDARLVYGETAGSGAVILFDRGLRELPPLTEQRKRFLSATIEPVYGPPQPLPPNGEPRASPRDTNRGVELDISDHRPAIDGSRN